MSQHPSLRSSDKDKQHRSVLKRYERLKILKDKEKWKEDETVFGLPKVKVLRFKIKKEKAPVAAEGAEAAAVAPGTEAAPIGGAATPSKGAPTPKGAAPKEATKPKEQAKPERKKESK